MKTRLIASGVAAGAFVASLFYLLATSIPATVERSLTDDALTATSSAVELPELRYQRVYDTQAIYRVRLLTNDLADLVSHNEIRLLVANFGTNPHLEVGQISVPGWNCTYRTIVGEPLPNNARLPFLKQPGCGSPPPKAAGEVTLTFRFRTPVRVALWTADRPDHDVGTRLFIADRTVPSGANRALRGSLVNSDPSNRADRLALLAYVWQISPSSRWLVVCVAIAGCLIAMAVWVLSSPGIIRGSRSRLDVLRGGFGVFCAASALSMTYAVLVPPFQAADEPNHFVGFLVFLHRPQMAGEAAVLAQLGHFERIQFHPEQHFTPADVGKLGIPWKTGVAPEGAIRGEGIRALWVLLAPFVHTLPVSRLLLTERLLNALVFSASVGLLVLLLGTFTPTAWPVLGALPIFLVPTLPFFGMHVSNYATLCAVYVLLAAGLLIQFWNGPLSGAAGPVMGLAWAAATLLSRSAFPLAPLIVSAVIARLVIGPGERTFGESCVYWIGLTAALALGIAMADPEYARNIQAMTSRALPGALKGAVGSKTTWQWALLISGMCGIALERFRGGILRIASTAFRERVSNGTAGAALALAALIVLGLAASLFIDFPILSSIDPKHPPQARAYVLTALLTEMTMFRLRHVDFLTSQTFWGGFGWLDTLLPTWLVSLLAASSGLALASLFVWISRTSAVKTGLCLGLFLCGIVASLAASAFSVIRLTPADLHGRYLLGVYLCLLTLCWNSVPRTLEGRSSNTVGRVLAVCGTCILILYLFSFSVILRRYF